MFRFRNFALRGLCLLLSMVTLALAVLPASAAPGETAGEQQEYATVVHCYASYDSVSVGQFEDGVSLSVLGQTDYFFKVDCYDMTGYVAKSQVRCENEEYYVNCDPESSETLVLTYETMSQALTLRAQVLQIAQSKLGCPYVYGATGPYSFDCSGFTSYVLAQNGIAVHRTADAQLQDGLIVSRDGLQTGDLVFFREPGSGDLASHVGIYVGDGQMIHAGSRGICYASIEEGYFAQRYICARRYINVSAAPVDAVASAVTNTAAVQPRTVGVRTAG